MSERAEAILDAWAEGQSSNEIAAALGCSRGCVAGVVHRAKINGDARTERRAGPSVAQKVAAPRSSRPNDWTSEHDNILRRSAGKNTAREIAALVGDRSPDAVRGRARHLKISLSPLPAPKSANKRSPSAHGRIQAPIIEPKHDGSGVSFLDVRFGQCRFPPWEGRVTDITTAMVCGAPTATASCSWCEAHLVVVSAKRVEQPSPSKAGELTA